MKNPQATPVLSYSRLREPEAAAESAAEPIDRSSRLNEIVTWAVLGICLAAWAVVGLFLWIPRVLRAVLSFSARLVHSTLAETSAEPAGRRLRSAASFYRRGFVAAIESIRPAPARDDAPEVDAGPSSADSGLLVREAMWAIAVWYLILWSAGPLRGTPVDLAAVPWSRLWSGWVDAIWSVPDLFRS